MAKYIETDLYFSDDGDFILSANKDLQDTSTNPHRSLIQGIKARLNFNRGEWPGRGNDIGANLSDFYGKQNTETTGEQLKLRVINELTKGGFIAVNDLFVDVIPLDTHVLLVKILVRAGNTIIPFNTRFSLREKTYGKKGKIN